MVRSSGGTEVGETPVAKVREKTVGTWKALDVQTLGSPPENRPTPPDTAVRGQPVQRKLKRGSSRSKPSRFLSVRMP